MYGDQWTAQLVLERLVEAFSAARSADLLAVIDRAARRNGPPEARGWRWAHPGNWAALRMAFAVQAATVDVLSGQGHGRSRAAPLPRRRLAEVIVLSLRSRRGRRRCRCLDRASAWGRSRVPVPRLPHQPADPAIETTGAAPVCRYGGLLRGLLRALGRKLGLFLEAP